MNSRTIVRVLTVIALFASMAPGLTGPAAVHAAPNPPPGTWPFWRYDLQRTNRVPPAVAGGNITQPAIKWVYPVGGYSNAWVADITGETGLPDGLPEIITYGGGRVRAFNPRNAQALWISDLIPGLQTLAFVGDVDANSSIEILAFARTAERWQVHTLAGSSGQRLSLITDAPGGTVYVPIVADANGDGKMELFESTAMTSTPTIYTFAGG
ncbi:MAG: hypothetical protein RMN25_08670, partial [Anaerolineae bacterium]|nr:hypothetical protein [Thermoflexales bacterium]MDW8407846.1 hypothetical protein [Anaerolineae bacterium]